MRRELHRLRAYLPFVPLDLRIGSKAVKVAHRYTTRIISVRTRDAAIMQIMTEKADAMVFDLPQLQHYLAQNPSLLLSVIDSGLARQTYGFALARGNDDLLRTLDVALLSLLEDGRMAQIKGRFISSQSGQD